MAKKIPYGISDYARIIKENYYYVDKTRFIESVEAAPPFLFLIRPRRFGKSLWLNTMMTYYDVNEAPNFDRLFGETYIGQHSTEEKNNYLILNFNFSGVNPDLVKLETSFEDHCSKSFDNFNAAYRSLLGEDYISNYPNASLAESKMEYVSNWCKRKNLSIYLFIDEYDNFTNTILSQHGEQKYAKITHGNGFFRLFFNKIKLATTGKNASLKKIFITGVSPVTLDDVTSGFNIAKNITTDAKFNSIIGFTEAEVITLLNHYKEAGLINEPIENLLVVMREWYNNYCFSEDRIDEKMYNSDMTLYFLDNYLSLGVMPKVFVDNNIKIDYGKLRHLIILDKKVNGNFSTIKRIAEEGEIRTSIVTSFPAEKFIKGENFVSLLYYFGILTIRRVEFGNIYLGVPNRAIREVLFSYIVEGYEDADIFKPNMMDFGDRMYNMAFKGDWKPAFNFLAEAINTQSSLREYVKGEKFIQTFHVIYMGLPTYYHSFAEYEMNKGFADLWLQPNFIVHKELPHSYLVEFKYAKREQEADIKNPNSALTQSIHEEADAQLHRYAADPRILTAKGTTTLHLLRVIYCGWEMVSCEEVV